MTPLDQHIEHFPTLRSIRIPQTMKVVTRLILFSVVFTVLFLVLVPWVQNTAATGKVTTLDPGDRQQNINALVTGRIDQWFVRDGSAVRKGDPIVRLSDIDPQLLQRLESERVQVELQLSAARTGMATAQLDLTRMRGLFEEGLAARRDFEQAQIRVEEWRGRVAEAEANLARMEVSLSRQSEQTVFAPRDGYILSVNAGDTATLVSAGDTLATFVPEYGERVIEVFIEGRDVALVHPGERATVQFEGWPVVQFSGWPTLAIGMFHGIVVAVDGAAQPDGRFRVLISENKDAKHPWPSEQYVRFGSSARAWILFETVPVGFEIWRQVNNFPPLMTERPRIGGTGYGSAAAGSGS